MQKNKTGQQFRLKATNSTTGAAVTGDAANITAKIRKDFGSYVATDDTNPTESENGGYDFDALQAETNADVIDIEAVSSTANVIVVGIPAQIVTTPLGVNTALGGLAAPGTSLGVVQNQDLDSVASQAAAVAAVALTEPTNLADKTLGGILYHLRSRFFNKVTQTTTTQTVYKDDGTTALGTMTVADDNTTQSKAEANEA